MFRPFLSLFTTSLVATLVPRVWAQSADPVEPFNETVQVQAKRLDSVRNSLSPQTGSSVYRFDRSDILALPQGDNTALNQVLLQAPGVVQDSYGQIHVRGDHGNVQYRIDGVVIPEPITGFGPAIDTRFASQVNLLTGALPAQYGYRTAGVVDIQTRGTDMAKNGEAAGEISTTVGTKGNREISGSVGTHSDNWVTFFSGDWLANDLGIENPTSSANALHDHTAQGKGFAYAAYLIDASRRVSLMLGDANSQFQIPDVPGQTPNYTLSNSAPVNSATLNAQQHEENQFQVLSYQQSGPWNYQVSVFHRRSTVDYTPDPVGDLVFYGIASQIHHGDEVLGTQMDTSRALNETHTLRMGLFAQHEHAIVDNTSNVFPADSNGVPTSSTPQTVVDNTQLGGNLMGAYAQDEWRASPALTVNYGLRYDHVNTVTDAMQWSPRLGMVYDLSNRTRVHAGYARYFTPPPTELIDTRTVALFANTTNALPSNANTAVMTERSHYFDLGLSQIVSKSLTLGLDAYYRQVRNLQDEGQFGNALIYSAFNYAQGRVDGVELSANYHQGPFAANLNLTRSQAMGKNVETGQFNFSPAELAYISNHWVHLDHDQAWTSSGGASYKLGDNHYFLDWTAGTGLRSGFANTDHLPAYWQWNAAVSHEWGQTAVGALNLRLTVVNLLDRVYELRDGTSIGVGAPQYGQRRTFYVSVSHPFGA